MTTYLPMSFIPPQFVDANGTPYSGAVLKLYSAGTSTPISMATDYTGGTLVSTMTLNASGYPAVSGNVVIPHVAENFKIALYPDSSSATSNTGAIFNPDNVQVSQNANATRYINYATDTGSANAYVIAPDPAISAYSAGQVVTLSPINANTGACTIAISGLATKNIKTQSGANPSAATMLAGGMYFLEYNGTNFILQNPSFVSQDSNFTLLGTSTASASSVLDFNSMISNSYSKYLMVVNSLVTSTTASINFAASTNNGSTFALNLLSQKDAITLGGTSARTLTGVNGSTPVLLTTSIATDTFCGYIEISRASGSWHAKSFIGAFNAGLAYETTISPANSTAMNAVELLPSSGTFTSGVVYFYGVKNT